MLICFLHNVYKMNYIKLTLYRSPIVDNFISIRPEVSKWLFLQSTFNYVQFLRSLLKVFWQWLNTKDRIDLDHSIDCDGVRKLKIKLHEKTKKKTSHEVLWFDIHRATGKVTAFLFQVSWDIVHLHTDTL